MSSDPIRAALERLINLDDAHECDRTWEPWTNAITAARAALAAAPEGEGPSVAEIDAAYLASWCEESGRYDIVAFARAVLARWGRPAAPPAPLEGEVGELVAWLLAYRNEEFGPLSDHPFACSLTRTAALLQQFAAAAPAVVPWSDKPAAQGRYICLRNGIFTMLDVNFYRDLQMGIAGQWEATEVNNGIRHGCPVANLQPASWLLVDDLPLPAPQGGEGPE